MAVSSSARFRSLVLLNSAGIRIKGVSRGDMFVCSEAELLKLLFAGDGAGAEWLQSWRATPDLEDIYDRNRAAAAKYSWSPRLCNPKLDRWLHRVGVATHIIWGKEDRVIPPAYAEALNGMIAGSTVATLPGCAHLAHIEQPQVFADQVSAIHPEGRADESLHVPPDALRPSGHELYRKTPRRMGGAAEHLLRSEEGPRALQPLPR